MKKEFYQYQFGNMYKVGQSSNTSALQELNNRFEFLLPTYLIEADQMKKMIEGINVKCDRALDPNEVEDMLNALKQFLISSIDSMDKYERKKHEQPTTEHEGAGSGDPEEVL